jgi:hypothetical protein
MKNINEVLKDENDNLITIFDKYNLWEDENADKIMDDLEKSHQNLISAFKDMVEERLGKYKDICECNHSRSAHKTVYIWHGSSSTEEYHCDICGCKNYHENKNVKILSDLLSSITEELKVKNNIDVK